MAAGGGGGSAPVDKGRVRPAVLTADGKVFARGDELRVVLKQRINLFGLDLERLVVKDKPDPRRLHEEENPEQKSEGAHEPRHEEHRQAERKEDRRELVVCAGHDTATGRHGRRRSSGAVQRCGGLVQIRRHHGGVDVVRHHLRRRDRAQQAGAAGGREREEHGELNYVGRGNQYVV